MSKLCRRRIGLWQNCGQGAISISYAMGVLFIAGGAPGPLQTLDGRSTATKTSDSPEESLALLAAGRAGLYRLPAR